MNGHAFTLAGAGLVALPSGALWWPQAQVLAVADLHLAKSDRAARRSGAMLPPYETRDTLARLAADIAETDAATVVCLGDSFDDLAGAAALDEPERESVMRLQTGRDWFWIEGNHDPGAHGMAGTHRVDLALGPITFRHVADPAARGEISGHYHPKARFAARGAGFSRPCFLYDGARVILPAYGTYTGGLDWTAPVLRQLMSDRACAVLTGPQTHALPMPRATGPRRPRPPHMPAACGPRR